MPSSESGRVRLHPKNSAYQQPNLIRVVSNVDLIHRNNRQELVRLCEKIRNAREETLLINFDSVEMISASGMLLLYAEVYRSLTQNVKIKMKYPLDKTVAKVLQHVGFSSMLGEEKKPKEEISEDNIASWQCMQGLKFDGEKVNRFLHELTHIDETKKRNDLYASIKEVIANAAEHAYYSVEDVVAGKIPDNDTEKTHFWLLYGRQNAGFLEIVIGDLGHGIPATIKKKRWFAEKNHSVLIKKAARLGESRVKAAQHRGKGLSEVVSDIPKVGGTVWIFSGKGAECFGRENSLLWGRDTYRAETRSLKNIELGGTVIQFRVPLSKLHQ